MDSKLSFTFGALSFSGEGNEKWLAEQMDKLIKALPSLGQIVKAPPPSASPIKPTPTTADDFKDSLASHLKAKGAESNQTKRFLATADWLRRRGATTLTTAQVSKALTDNQQKRLGNPSDCLNQNVGKGFCEKTNEGFYITPEGLTSLGYND